MTLAHSTSELFFNQLGLDRRNTEALVDATLSGCDDGELFLEYCQSESLALEDSRLKSASFDTSQGFGLRALAGEAGVYAHSSILSDSALRQSASTVRAVRQGDSGTAALHLPKPHAAPLYRGLNPLEEIVFPAKVALLQQIDAYARSKDSRVVQVMASLSGEWQAVHILRADGQHLGDIRPLVRLNVSVVVSENGRTESGNTGSGGRWAYDRLLDASVWQRHVDEALRQALVNLQAIPAPAGEMTVVLGPGWPGVLLHEAIGHGLEGDFNRKGTSAFAGLLGTRVAAKGVTVVDDGTLADRRGSLTIDDEGTPTSRTVLIEDGILRGFLQDRQNARLMGVATTGNGRRESFECAPMPRMTNTYMLAGNHAPEEILASVKRGLYAVNFGGGQVDITSGKFVFSASEAYLIEDGRVTAPVKGATLVGNGPDALTRVTMIGNDLQLDPGIGTCGKDGQSVPVGVGQPTLRVDGLTVGGTAA
jgi:TldD protein